MFKFTNFSSAFEVIRKQLTHDVHHFTNVSRKAFAEGDLKTAKTNLIYATRSSDFLDEFSAVTDRWMTFRMDAEFDDHNPLEEEQRCASEKLSRGKKTSFAVKLPDGRMVKESTCAKTFARVIELLGPEEIEKGHFMPNGDPLVTNDASVRTRYRRTEIADGWTVATHSSTAEKRIYLQRIATFLGINLEIIEIA